MNRWLSECTSRPGHCAENAGSRDQGDCHRRARWKLTPHLRHRWRRCLPMRVGAHGWSGGDRMAPSVLSTVKAQPMTSPDGSCILFSSVRASPLIRVDILPLRYCKQMIVKTLTRRHRQSTPAAMPSGRQPPRIPHAFDSETTRRNHQRPEKCELRPADSIAGDRDGWLYASNGADRRASRYSR